MSWLDTVSSWFGGQPSYADVETPPAYYEPTMSGESAFSSYPGQDYETPPEYMQSSRGYLGSLWDSFTKVGATAKKTVTDIYKEAKTVAPEALELYKTVHQIKNLDPSSLFSREPTRGTPESPDHVLYTPYQRESTGAQPAVITTGAGAGISMPLLLIAGAAALILFTRKRR